jgi:rhamnose transport system permease protein
MSKFSIRKNLFTWDKGVVLFLLISILIGSFGSQYFATASNLSFVIQSIAEIAIIATAMAFLIISGEIDLSVASMMALTSASIGYAFQAGVPFEASILIGLLVGLLAGIFNGVLVTVFGLPSLAVTIATLALYRGLCWVLLENKPVNQLPTDWVALGNENIPNTFLPWATIPLVLLAGAAWFVLHTTKLGRWVFVIGTNPVAAKFSGIPVNRVKLGLFAYSGLMSAVAGVIYTLRFASASPDGGAGYELSVIAAVLFGGVAIAGGVGTMWGVLAAVISLGVIRSALQLVGFSANALLVVSGGLLLISVILPRVTEFVRSQRSRASIQSNNKEKVNT